MPEDPFYRLTPLELATSWIPGMEPADSAGPDMDGVKPREALEQILRPVLQRSPCWVAFSGGRDSSALLALAVDLARREGLPIPVPYTQVYPHLPDTQESQWQEQVIRHLGVPEWERLILDDEGDVIGPLAREGLRRHGVLWPLGCHVNVPVWELTRDSVTITGNGGDEVFGPLRITPLPRLLSGQARSFRPVAKKAVIALLPTYLRRGFAARIMGAMAGLPWLRPAAREAFARELSRDMLDEPLRWDVQVRSLSRRRVWRAVERNWHLLAEMTARVRYVHPFLDDRFLAAWSAFGGWFGPPSRTTAMQRLFDDLLPEAVISRESKAAFNAASIHRHSREFIKRWQGGGVDHEVVDAAELRKAWEAPVPLTNSYLLLQAAWLAEEAGTERSPG